MIATRIDPDDPTTDDPYGALIDDLAALGYTAGDAVDGIITYAHPDGGGVLATIDEIRHLEARLRWRNDDGDPTWMVRLTPDVPPAVQRIVLHAVLHVDSGDEQAILAAIATAVQPDPRPTQ
ncbi:hypothetical protein Dvina_51400 [Dactylosporangium vinaceum]|uniref:Uncharacterized protein n=1 Tax=Dactylosporangium vinaceum TaxID=53362 RepID=A0ABV5M2Q5_9ACTN|nr:hypothetical protein [Dactylosporangium vinaceum]UAB96254.1 hypothetical protein Dvina_51400 [Dactylosporangium vinaceum]